MPQITYPNQRMIHIHRERASHDFLGIKNENWQAAARDLGAHALMLYLYLASNANDYKLALSPVAIRQTIGMAQSTYRDQFLKLVDKGYLVQRGDGNTYDFYETPQRDAHQQREYAAHAITASVPDSYGTNPVHENTPWDREININSTNIKNICGEKQVSPAISKEFRF